MKKAVNNKRKQVYAFQLGAGSEMEKKLIESGKIRLHPNGTFELFSLEAVNGQGELAHPGDYFKVDERNGEFFPYPNDRAFFEANHRHLSGDLYEQINRPLSIWEYGDEESDELRYLQASGKLTLRYDDPEHFFNAFLWGAQLSARQDAVIVLYDVSRNSNGGIEDISFNFVARDEFENSYTVTG